MKKIKIVKNHSKPSLFYKIKAPLYKKIILLQTKASLKANKKYHKINLKANSIKNPKILSLLLKNNRLKKINLTRRKVLWIKIKNLLRILSVQNQEANQKRKAWVDMTIKSKAGQIHLQIKKRTFFQKKLVFLQSCN